MADRYDKLWTSAFRLREREHLLHEFWSLALPEKWKEPLLALQAEGAKRQTEQNRIPIRLLNGILRATVPDLVSISRNAEFLPDTPWVYSMRAVPPEFLDPIIREWVRISFRTASRDNIERVLALIQGDDLLWQQRQVDLSAWHSGDNGTAEPDSSSAYTLLPEFLASIVAAPDHWYDLGDTPRQFYRALPDPWGTGAEVISWPPFTFQNSRGEWPFSMVLRFTVQTIAFDPQPVVHCEVGMRRWIGAPIRYLPAGNTSVFLRGRVPWIESEVQAQTFQVAPIRWKPDAVRSQNGETRGGFAWASDLAPLLQRLAPRMMLPDPQTLCKDPSRYLNGYDAPNVAIDFRNGMLPKHPVGAGWGPADRRDIVDQVTEVLAGVLEPRQSLPKVVAPVSVRRSLTSQPPERRGTASVTSADEHVALRKAIGRATGRAFAIDLLYQTDVLRDEVIGCLSRQLGVSPIPIQAGPALSWDLPGGTSVTVRPQQLGALGAGLDIPPDGNLDDRWRAALRQRSSEVGTRLARTVSVAGALIEIDPPDHFKLRADPKFALRLGAARQGRLSQFLLSETAGRDDALEHRVTQAWRDLFRQFGVQPVPPAFISRHYDVPDPLNYVAIWLIKQNRSSTRTGYSQQLPVMVWMASDCSDIRAFAPGFSDWLPYNEALLALSGLDVFERRGRNVGQTLQFIEQTLLHDILPLDNVLLLTDAHNLRGTWKWLKNGEVQRDRMRIGIAEPVDITRWPGARHVQVRMSANGETPECFGEGADRQGFPKGLWRMSERVFGSTAGKPRTQQHMLGNLSKLRAWHSSKRNYPPKPQAHCWNPALVEMAVIGIQPGDDPVLWAAITHELRFIASHYDDAISHPLPLHLASRMNEYALPMGEGEETEDESTGAAASG